MLLRRKLKYLGTITILIRKVVALLVVMEFSS